MSFTLSPNKLKLYSDCKRCFWENMHKGIERPSGPFPSLPSGMDTILKKHFATYATKGELPPELSGLEGKVEPFSNQALLKKWQGRNGIRWTDEQGNTLYGSVDNILVQDKKLIVLDYKTRGFALKEDTVRFYKDQMDIYNLLLEKNGFEVQDFSLLLFYIPQEITNIGEARFTTPLERVPVDTKRALDLYQNALGVLSKKRPASEKDCDFCAFARDKRK
jgi:hypothetical protein